MPHRTLPLDISSLLDRNEDQYFERKSLFEGPPHDRRPRARRKVRDQVAEYVAAFANADGGVLVLGVEDDGTVTGHAYNAEDVENILVVPERRLRPPLRRGSVVQVQDREVIVFQVDPEPSAVMVVGDGFPRRVDDQVHQESEQAINAIKKHGRMESIEEDSCPDASLDGLDLHLIRRASTAAGMMDVQPDDYLLARRLAARRGDTVVLRQGAVFLFAAKPWHIDHPNAGVRVFRVDGTERLTGAEANVQEFPTVEGALPLVIEKTWEVIGGLIHRSARLHDLFFRETPEYPTFAWQEALINAVAHRDYRTRARCIEVWLFDDRMEVVSPGGLLGGVSLDALRNRQRVHATRNPRLTRVLRELHFMRGQGEGIPRMYAEMERSFLHLPELSADEWTFTVTLRNRPIFEGADPGWLAHLRSLPVNDRQRRILAARPRGTFSNADYQALNQVDRDTAYREIRELVDQGLVVAPKKAGRGASYKVIGSQASAAVADPRPVLRSTMETAGSLRSADWQAATGESRQKASVSLASLVDAGILEKVGERKGVRYLPGPKWGAWLAAPLYRVPR